MSWRSDLPLLGRSRLRRAVVLAAVPALALTGVALSSAAPASASTSSCALYALCTWQNAGETGTQWNFAVTAGAPAGDWWYVGAAANDQISSIYNHHTSTDAFFNKDCPAGSDEAYIPPNTVVNNLAGTDWPDFTGRDNSISAWAVSNSIPSSGNC